jgi:hypothetical protein
LTVGQELLLREAASIADRCSDDFRHHCNVKEYCRNRCKLVVPVLLASDVLEPVCTMCAQIAARYSEERVNTWIQSHITPGVCPDTLFFSYMHIAHCAVMFKAAALTSVWVSI